ncbi:MAG: alpha-2-macroglobulin family protein, partial [Ferruginibacter sp.]
TVTLYDANGEKKGNVDLLSNEYGSYNGSFKLPEGGLNGQFYIRDSANQAVKYFNVEEYKRPKFSVEIKKPIGTYRVNDSILVTGNAKAYSGNNVDGAKVTYRVVRKVRYPDWWGWSGYGKRGIPFGNNDEMEITNGETLTNNKGEFFITFKAIPDETVDKKSQPVFNYEISTDITDINGETRSGSTIVAVAYQALQLNIIADDQMPVDSLKNIKISSTNINDLFERSKVNLTVYKLQSPNKIFRERYWEMPDIFTLTKAEFTKDFPFDAYSDEDKINKWPLLEKVIDLTDSTSENSTFKLQNLKLNPGWFKIIVTSKDKYGEDVKAEKYVRLTNDQQTETEEPVSFEISNIEASPGQRISYFIATGFEKIWLIHSVNKVNASVITSHPVIVSKNPYRASLDITENDRGGINLGYAFVLHNRTYSATKAIDIPWSNKDLKISYETFRDKLLPGSSEKWKLKISGNKAEKVAAETLVSMYDASLDQFQPHSWPSLKSVWAIYPASIFWTSHEFGSVNSEEKNNIKNNYVDIPARTYEELLNNGWNEGNHYRDRLDMMATSSIAADNVAAAAPVYLQRGLSGKVSGLNVENNKEGSKSYKLRGGRNEDTKSQTDSIDNPEAKTSLNSGSVQVRKNFNETAFFFPTLNTDSNGNIEFSFTIPEALTSWRMMTLAHTKDLASTYSEKTVITQKPLMVQPNPPRFLREGDRMEFSSKIVNLSDSEITGTAQLELLDAATNKPVDGWFKNIFPVQYFTIAAGQSTSVKFPVEIPFAFNSALTWRIKASSKNGMFSDGEENALPVLTNRMLVTETMPLNMRNETTKNFKFEKLLSSNNSGSLTNHALTVEYTSNPAWYAVQALPYLMEFPYECAEQSFNRYYSNALASYVCNSMPKIKTVFEKWLTPRSQGRGAGGEADSAKAASEGGGLEGATLSNLQKNEELKSALLQETPWVMAAQNETEQKKNIAVLFEMVRLANEKEKTYTRLKEMQTSNGGFSWFKGGRDDRYITQYIITGIGHLRKLNALNNDDYNNLKGIVEKALPYLDARLKEDYDDLKKY